MYACLTVGDTITIVHGVNTFLIDIVEVRPGNAISIIDTDVNVLSFYKEPPSIVKFIYSYFVFQVEFEPPKDYVNIIFLSAFN